MALFTIPAVMSLTAQGAGTVVSGDVDTGRGLGLHLYINVTATGGSPTLTVTLQGKSPQGGYYTILTSAAISATGLTVLKVYPGLTATANLVANDVLPKMWRLSAVIAGTTPSVTGTIAATVID